MSACWSCLTSCTANPDLFIDCTFETAGKLQLMDYAIANHADGNWLSNFEEAVTDRSFGSGKWPGGVLRLCLPVPWSSEILPWMIPEFEFALKSLIGTLPIVLGDPRANPYGRRARIIDWSEWMQEMQNKYDYMSFRRDLPGFGEPREGHWDGWMRINNDTQTGGIAGVFRQGAMEEHRQVFLKGLVPEREYKVRLAPMGEEVLTATGKELMEKGFNVNVPGLYDGNIYEIAPDQ